MGPHSYTRCGDLVLEDMGIVVERVHDDPPATKAETVDVPGRHGTILREVTFEPRAITLECRAFCEKWAQFDALKDRLASELLGREVNLTVRTHPDEYYVAYLSEMTEGDRIGGTGIGALELAFVATDPLRYGETKQVTVPSAGTATFRVGGTMTASVALSATAAVRDNSTGLWGVQFDQVDYLYVAPSVGTAVTVAIDCDDRSVKVAGATSMVTITSDWPVLEPGAHSVTMTKGTGAATLTWQERSI